MKGNDDLIREVKHEVRKLVESSSSKKNLEPNWAYLRQLVRDQVGEYLFQKNRTQTNDSPGGYRSINLKDSLKGSLF
jgi:hypothetical protein